VLWLWWMEQLLASSVRSKLEISCAKQHKVSKAWWKKTREILMQMFQVWTAFSSILINNTAWNAAESQAAWPLPRPPKEVDLPWMVTACYSSYTLSKKESENCKPCKLKKCPSLYCKCWMVSIQTMYIGTIVSCLFLYTSQPNRGKTSDCHQLHISKLPQAGQVATTHDTGRSFPREHHRHGHARKLKEVNTIMSVEFGRCML
jgi:hypothetical protein